MRFSQVVSMLLGFMAGASLVSAEESKHGYMDVIVQEASHGFPTVMSQVVQARRASGIPLRKRDAKGLLDRNGKKFKKVIPFDLERRYDEASYAVYDRAIRKGMTIPRQTAVGQDECLDTEFYGLILGFAYGLQYNRKIRGPCYMNIETSVLALQELTEEFYMIFLPWEWGTLSLSA